MKLNLLNFAEGVVMSAEKMTRKELKFTIASKLEEIRELYYEAYPEGDYLAMNVTRKSMMFNNRYWNKDKKYKLNWFKAFKKEIEEYD